MNSFVDFIKDKKRAHNLKGMLEHASLTENTVNGKSTYNVKLKRKVKRKG